jgi:hypothetical protein
MLARFSLVLTLLAWGCSAQDTPLLAHFKKQVKDAAYLKTASRLPSSAVKPIFHMDLSLFGEDGDDSIYESMMDHETSLRMKSSADDKFPFIACGSQQHSKAARSEISKYDSGRLMMAFSSRSADVSCWRASLTNSEADKLADSSAFFHVTQVPGAGKFSPELLLTNVDGHIVPSQQVIDKGLTIRLDRNLDLTERVKFMKKWETEHFGLTSHQHMENFFATSTHNVANPWNYAKTIARESTCHQVIQPSFVSNAKPSDYLFQLNFESQPDQAQSEVNACVLSALVYLATQNQVMDMEPVSDIQLHAFDKVSPITNRPITAMKPSVADGRDTTTTGGDSSIMNVISTTSLQSGDSGDPNPFWDLGLDGTGQFVEVADTGFDDASCFFRPVGSASVLTGDFNGDVQVARSTYDSPTTDTSFRKIIQYLMRDATNDVYGYDYAAGHGTHCAGTVAGYISSSTASVVIGGSDYYSDCIDYIDYCDTWFCSTCGSNAGTCDATCGFETTTSETYPGTAPGAQLMVYDFGDASGGLSIDSDMGLNVFYPAYNEGARIFSNSWASSAPYNYYDTRGINIDEFVYDEDDALILFAAGNSGGAGYDDSTEDATGDASIGSPGICKNVITVGAAETSYTPDTVADFSSRGPSKDMRLKPEVVGPGNPVMSASASGSYGLASCTATSKSGTSMATPAVAGASAIILQILTEGEHQTFSPDGYAASSYSETAPSAALLKALLIGSTSQMTYGYDSSGASVTLADFYSASGAVADTVAYPLGTSTVDFTQGFGHVRLSNVFSLDGSFDTFLYEDSIGEYATWTKTFTVLSTATEVDVTLVWTDPPGSAYCGYYYQAGAGCLVHDLDLKVYNDGVRFYSNFGAGDGDYNDQEDIDNNAEKVTISTGALGTTITVSVESNGLSYADSQKFALVVTGDVEVSSGTGITPVPAPTVSSVTTPVPAPTKMPTEGGYCLSGSSTVHVLAAGSDTLATVKTPISEVNVGDKILAKSITGEHIYTKVRALPHSVPPNPFIEIEMSSPPSSSEPSFQLQATPFHTFPTCGKHHEVIEAHKLNVGDCLQTIDGERRVARTTMVMSSAEDTYSIVVDDRAKSVAVGGVFTHARNNGMHHNAAPKVVKKNLRHSKSNIKGLKAQHEVSSI